MKPGNKPGALVQDDLESDLYPRVVVNTAPYSSHPSLGDQPEALEWTQLKRLLDSHTACSTVTIAKSTLQKRQRVPHSPWWPEKCCRATNGVTNQVVPATSHDLFASVINNSAQRSERVHTAPNLRADNPGDIIAEQEPRRERFALAGGAASTAGAMVAVGPENGKTVHG